jgi:outer membrane biosynthesis protein TonB
MQPRRSALVSVVGHAAFIALLALVGTRPDRASNESPLIMAELITALEPATTSAVTVTPEAPEAPAEESAPAPQPPTAELDTAAPAPPPPPQPEAEPEPVAPRTVEPSTEPPPIERFAEVEEPATEPVIEPPAPEIPSEAEPLTTGPAAETVVDDAPRRSFASNEEQSVRRKLSSWTGSFETANAMPTLTWRDDGQEFTAVLKRSSAAEATGMEQVLV